MKLLEQRADKLFKLTNDLQKFISTDPDVNRSYQEFRTINSSEKGIYEFIFDKEFTNDKKLVDIYLSKTSDISKEDKTAFMEFKNTVNSIFEVINFDKEGFELYNLVNERTYRVKSLVKMVNYRKVYKGSYLACRLVPFEGEYYLFVFDRFMNNSDRASVYQAVVTRQIENPEIVYEGNEEKFREIEENVEFLGRKFGEFFQGGAVVTLSTKINDLLNTFNDYVDGFEPESDIAEFIENPIDYVYDENLKVYDVGLLFDSENGLQTVPFYATFCKIFEADNYKSVKGYQSCVKNFFNNDKISMYVLKTVHEKYADRFLERAKQILKIKKDIDFDELMHRYKSVYIEQKRFSTPTILYSSDAFDRLMDLSAESGRRKKGLKAGRNEPCPCGSGKKYKKCCL